MFIQFLFHYFFSQEPLMSEIGSAVNVYRDRLKVFGDEFSKN